MCFQNRRQYLHFDHPCYHHDLTDEKGSLEIIKKYNPEMIIGGPPCQDFSSAGKRDETLGRADLTYHFANVVTEYKAKWFVMENVEGLLTTKRGEYVYEVAKAFIKLGYWIRIDKLYAHEYGIPQRRKRVFIIGNCLGYDFTDPKPTVPIQGAIFRQSNLTLRHAIAGLPSASEDKQAYLKYDSQAKAFVKNSSALSYLPLSK